MEEHVTVWVYTFAVAITMTTQMDAYRLWLHSFEVLALLTGEL